MEIKLDNVLAYLTPKSQVAFLISNYTIRQALEKMKFHRYTSVPVIDKFGKYVGTITEGDLLWYMVDNKKFKTEDLESVRLSDIPRTRDNFAVNANTKLESLVDAAVSQNFIPIVDDQNNFIGIVTRKSVISYLTKI
ncbi:MAG: CBS domain-containing protein [Bacilli bacterium]